MSEKTDFETALRSELDPRDGSERVSAFLFRLSRLSFPLGQDRDRLKRIASLFDDNEQVLQEKKEHGHIKADETDIQFLTRLSDRPSWVKDRPRLRRMVEHLNRVEWAGALIDGSLGPMALFMRDVARCLDGKRFSKLRAQAVRVADRIDKAGSFGAFVDAKKLLEDSPSAEPTEHEPLDIDWVKLAWRLRYRLPHGVTVHREPREGSEALRVMISEASLLELTRDNAPDIEREVTMFAERMRTLIGGPLPMTAERAKARIAVEIERRKANPADIPLIAAESEDPLPELCEETNAAEAARMDDVRIADFAASIGQPHQFHDERTEKAAEKVVGSLGKLGTALVKIGEAAAKAAAMQRISTAASETRRVAAYGGDSQAAAYAATHAAAAAVGVPVTDVGTTVAEAVVGQRSVGKTHAARGPQSCPRKWETRYGGEPDDWACPGCDWTNPHRFKGSGDVRDYCYNCGSPRPHKAVPAAGAGDLAIDDKGDVDDIVFDPNGETRWRWPESGGDTAALSKVADALSNQWTCRALDPTTKLECSALNGHHPGDLCWRCKAPRPTAADARQSGSAWRCPCDAGNRADSVSCWKCGGFAALGRKISPTEKLDEQPRPKPWRCEAPSPNVANKPCRAANNAGYLSCWRCHSPAPGEAACVRWECTLCHFEQNTSRSDSHQATSFLSELWRRSATGKSRSIAEPERLQAGAVDMSQRELRDGQQLRPVDLPVMRHRGRSDRRDRHRGRRRRRLAV